jgi:hypothetical protein
MGNLANYDHKPPVWNANGDGSFTYRWNIQESAKEDFGHEGENVARASWNCEEVVVWPTVTRGKLTALVLAHLWSSDDEAKLVNNYNAAKLGQLDGSHIAAYEEFIKQRKAVKRMVAKDYREIFGIERTLQDAIEEKLAILEDYDTSTEINSFTINGVIPAWISKEDRAIYGNSVASARKVGDAIIKINLGGTIIPLDIDQADYALSLIQRYADKAAITTAEHRNAINALKTIEEVDAYNHTANYPEKIDLTVPMQ